MAAFMVVVIKGGEYLFHLSTGGKGKGNDKERKQQRSASHVSDP
jgi:hypothetical protein